VKSVGGRLTAATLVGSAALAWSLSISLVVVLLVVLLDWWIARAKPRFARTQE
jgi:hypothetical protein